MEKISSLKRRFLIPLGAVYALTILVSFAALARIADDIIIALGTNLAENQALYNRSRTLQPLLQEVAMARKLADSPTLKEWAANEGNAVLAGKALAELESYRRFFRDSSWFFIVDSSRHYYFNDAAGSYGGNELRYTLDPDKPKDSWYFATLKNEADYALNVNPDVHLGVTKVWINVLVRDKGRVIGLAGTGIDLSTFIKEVVGVDSDKTINILVTADGAIQAHPDSERIDFASLTKDTSARKTLFSLIDTDLDRQAFRDALARLAGDPRFHAETLVMSVEGRRYLAGLTHLPEIGWFNVSLIDADTVLHQGQIITIALTMVVALGVVLLATALLLRRLVLGRIAQLVTATRAIGHENGTVPEIPDGEADEIGHLGESFREMAATIRNHTHTLESEVEARTSDLRRSNAELEQFAYAVSHDLRQPLRMISGYLSLLERRMGPSLDGELKSFLGFAVDGARRLDQLIIDLLEYARVGRDAPEPAPVALDDIVADTVRGFAPQAQEAKAFFDVAQGFPVIMADPLQVRRLFDNLIGNALKYRSPERSPVIEIGWKDDGGTLVLWVKDNGIGIDPADHERAFGIFQRLVPPAQCEGSGIGLAVCRKIVEHMGGRIWIDSQPGEGSTFFVALAGDRAGKGG